jgi:hypothetical protein
LFVRRGFSSTMPIRRYYPSGHTIYLNVDALHQLKDDLAAFIDKATKQ